MVSVVVTSLVLRGEVRMADPPRCANPLFQTGEGSAVGAKVAGGADLSGDCRLDSVDYQFGDTRADA